jgi:hypothetical protein
MVTPPINIIEFESNDANEAWIGAIITWASFVSRDVKCPDVVPSKKAVSWRITDLNKVVRTPNRMFLETTENAAW